MATLFAAILGILAIAAIAIIFFVGLLMILLPFMELINPATAKRFKRFINKEIFRQ